MSDSRPNPDLLLAEVRKQEAKQQRGKLKVFFGMAAGVGKTFAMLEEARARAAEGLDVLIGYAEPHIRTETESLLLGMELLPYRTVDYRNTTLKEFDLDAALARKPALICVDELAHSNAPGMRHAKRWQDVTELLAAGINVYTTLNVQHLESVNDIVERISGVKVRETLPDSVLEQADEVELVDIAPEELLERFREGKVYRPDQAEQAARHFFTKGNLIALRELALRTTAQRVDAQMDDFRRENVVRTPWQASERILVCVGPSPLSARLVRAARRLASGLKAPLIAAYVEKPGGTARLGAADRRRVDQTLRLAEQLGAQAVTLAGENVADELIAYAGAHNVTKIVIGKPQRSRWRDFLFESVVDDLIRRSGQIDIYVIRGDETDERPQPAPPLQKPATDWRGFAWAVGVVLSATGIGWPLYHGIRHRIENENVLMLYLLGVLWVATRYSREAAILTSLLAVAAFDLIFVPPYYTLVVSDQQYLVTFVVMLATALVISGLTHRVRAQAEASRQRERRTAALLALARELAVARSPEQIVQTAVRAVSDVLGGRAALLLPEHGGRQLVLRADTEGGGALDARDLGVAQWAFEHGQEAGLHTPTLPATAGRYVPLIDSRGTAGVLAIYPPDGANDWNADQRQLVQAFANLVAVAVGSAMLADEARQAWERVEAECLRNTLLSGVSHELRTPLAAITGASSTLIESGDQVTAANRAELLDSIASESERMERLITNLLDMTRLEAGGLIVKKEWQPFQEVFGSVLHRLDRRLRGRRVNVDVPSDLPLVQIDAVLIEQVLMNLLDNAMEYTPPGSGIDISARAASGGIEVEVADEGPGIPAGTEDRVFQKFFRAARPENRRGVGLGLAICRGIVEAHGGKITARSRTTGGAAFRFTIPSGGTPPSIDASA